MKVLPHMSIVLFTILSSIADVAGVTPPARGMCADLGSAEWSGFRIDSARVLEGTEAAPAHCRVQGTIDVEIHFELLMPMPDAWNGRLVMGGGGGFVGSVENQAIVYAPYVLQNGFATVGTDTGHQGSGIDASWALQREDREVNFGHRAVHVTVEAAKTIMHIHYGRDIKYSYWLGCSRGGGQAMVESQRYPDDFDGIVAGAPAYDWLGGSAHFVQTQQAMYPEAVTAEPVITPEIRQFLHDQIIAKCDEIDGVSDGMITDPRDCSFDPADLPRCEGGSTPTPCVKGNQLRAMKAVYEGAVVDGEHVYPGFPLGAEAEWEQWITGGPNKFGPGLPSLQFAFSTQIFKYLVFDDPEWEYGSYDFSNWNVDTRRAGQVLNATNTDLTTFKIAGGRLILWHGWADGALSALGTIEYYEGVRKHHPDSDEFVRLFLLPGVEHCGGGPGPDVVDWLRAIQAWVEKGEAPTRLTATKLSAEGEIEMTRPVCAYPAKARYSTNGDPLQLESFKCATPLDS